MTTRALTWSYGGGTQSVAIAVLVAQGKLPVPECIIIADTGREATETWDYLHAHVAPLLATVGARVEVASHRLATVDLYGKNGDGLMPVFTASGKLPTLCSNEWKKRVVSRYLRAKGYGPANPVLMWIGFSVDEVERAKPSGTAWQEVTWPLLFDVPMRRSECRSLVLAAGLPEPPKSSCYMCPHRGNDQWKRLRDHYPEDWRRAVELDREVRAKDERGGVFLHRSLVPLDEAVIDAEESGQPDLFGADCGSGYCFV